MLLSMITIMITGATHRTMKYTYRNIQAGVFDVSCPVSSSMKSAFLIRHPANRTIIRLPTVMSTSLDITSKKSKMFMPAMVMPARVP